MYYNVPKFIIFPPIILNYRALCRGVFEQRRGLGIRNSAQFRHFLSGVSSTPGNHLHDSRCKSRVDRRVRHGEEKKKYVYMYIDIAVTHVLISKKYKTFAESI